MAVSKSMASAATAAAYCPAEWPASSCGLSSTPASRASARSASRSGMLGGRVGRWAVAGAGGRVAGLGVEGEIDLVRRSFGDEAADLEAERRVGALHDRLRLRRTL